MKLAVALVLSVFAYCALAERCNNVTECVGTSCAPTATHVHVECTEHHCTCSQDPKPCLQKPDCDSQAICIDNDGHKTHFHCLDSLCICIRV